ncbi:MAG TPA: RDD family protein [Steroidobacteraceae bacterium]|nr:RDD family protein [Steroidobacteraceae bacterium]
MLTSLSTRSALIAALLAMSLAATAWLPAPVAAAAAATAPSASQPARIDADAADSSAPEPAAADADDEDSENWNGDDKSWNRFGRRRPFRHNGNDLVSIGHDAMVPEGGQRDSVVAVFGSASNYGTANQDVVSVFGNTTVKGPTDGSAVAVLGNVSVDGDVGEDVVAVLGNVDLGPHAHVHGHVVSVLGTVNQDPAAIVDRGLERVLPENIATAEGIRNWVGHGLMVGRPLVIGSGLRWLWTLSLALLAVYVILALLFRDAAEHCIATLNDNPGKSLLTAFLAVLLTPLMMFLLAVTLIGIPLIPIFLVTLFVAGLFGKATVLGWIGGRCLGLRQGQTSVHPALAVLLGGIVVMLAYLVPVLGFVVYILLSMIGYGAVLYALLNRMRRSRAAAPGNAGVGATSAVPPFAPASADPATAQVHEAATEAPAAGATESPAAPSAPLPLTTLPRPGFWPRMGALFIDAIIVGVVVRVLLDWPYGSEHRLFLLGLAVYGAVMWKVKGTTIGGIVFDLRVVRLDSRALDWPTVCVRALGCILSLCALGLGFFWIGIDPGKQAWHDKLAGTIVVRVPKGSPLV